MAVATSRTNLVLDRIRDFIGTPEQKVYEGDTATGLFRIGGLGSFSGTGWYYQRIVNSVYYNPTGKRCSDAIASAFARAPLKCYKPGDEIRETPIDSPLQTLLNQPVPNRLSVPAVSGQAAARKRARDMTLAGMSLTLKIRGDGLTTGPITQLRRLPPQRVTVLGNQHDELLGFIYHDRVGGQMPILPRWAVYEHFSHPDRDYQPFPPALAAGLGAETDNKAARFNLDLLENDGAIPAVVMLEGLKPDQFGEWVAAWEAHENPGKVRFMGFTGTPAGGKSVEVVPLGQSNKELLQDKIRDYAQEDVRKALGCPPVIAYDMDHETYANAAQEMELWYGNTIWDYWTQSSDEQTAQLGWEFGVELGYFTGQIPELQESKDSMVTRELTLQDHGNLTINATNERLGLPPVAWGDAPLAPMMKMSPIPIEPPAPDGGPGPTPPAPPAPKAPPPPKAALPRFKRPGGAALAIEATPPRDASAHTTADREAALTRLEAFTARRLERYFARQGRVIAKRLLSPGRNRSTSALIRRGYFDTLRWDEDLTEDVAAILADVAAVTGVNQGISGTGIDGELAKRINRETKAELDVVVDVAVNARRSVAEIADAVRGYFDQRATERAGSIAKEITNAED